MPTVLRSVVERLPKINTKWWCHGLFLIQEIGLEGSETKTAQELLRFVIQHAEDTESLDETSNFVFEEERFGVMETFATIRAGETKTLFYGLPWNWKITDQRVPVR